MTRSSSNTMSAGISPAMMREKIERSLRCHTSILSCSRARDGSPAPEGGVQHGECRGTGRRGAQHGVAEADEFGPGVARSASSSCGAMPPSGPTTSTRSRPSGRIDRSAALRGVRLEHEHPCVERRATRVCVVVASSPTSGTHARIDCLAASRTIVAQRSRPFATFGALPAGDRPRCGPRDDRVDAQLGRRLDGELVAVALGERLHEGDARAGRRRPASTGLHVDRSARPAWPRRPRRSPTRPRPFPISTVSPGRVRLTVAACFASAPVSDSRAPGLDVGEVLAQVEGAHRGAQTLRKRSRSFANSPCWNRARLGLLLACGSPRTA